MNIQTDTYSSSTIPADMAYVRDARTGKEVLVDLRDLPAGTALPNTAPPPAPVVHVVERAARQRDPMTSRILAGGLSTAGVVVAAGHYAHNLGEIGHAVEMAGIGLGVVTAGLYLLKSASPRVNVNVTANITGASATAGSTASSAAGWNANA